MGTLIELNSRGTEDKNPEITDLPFVVDRLVHEKGKKRRTRQRCFWAIEPSGDYSNDCNLGNELAREYLAHQQMSMVPLLQWIVLDMPSDFTGVEIGFLGEIARNAALGFRLVEELDMNGSCFVRRGDAS